VLHDDFIKFKATEADKDGSYNLYTKADAWLLADALQQADLLKPAVINIETSRQLAIIENKFSRRRDPPRLKEADFNKLTKLLEFGSTGAEALLAAEADARSKPADGGTSALTSKDLGLIDWARATVQIKRFELDKYLLDVERAVHNEVCKR